MKVNKLILPVISAIAITGCSHMQIQAPTRDNLLDQLGGTQEGVQPDESVIACGEGADIETARIFAEQKIRELLESHTVITEHSGSKNESICNSKGDKALCCIKAKVILSPCDRN
jgi:hypothetical protein